MTPNAIEHYWAFLEDLVVLYVKWMIYNCVFLMNGYNEQKPENQSYVFFCAHMDSDFPLRLHVEMWSQATKQDQFTSTLHTKCSFQSKD